MPTTFLRDLNQEVVAAWRIAFEGAANVEVSLGNILELEADAIVSPANSFGYMDGGIDLAYLRHFGAELEDRLRAVIQEEYFGELPVGQAIIVPTGNSRIPHLISAPTMRLPGDIAKTTNVYLAYRAALIAVERHNRAMPRKITSLLVPGLGTGIGDMPPHRAATQMRLAHQKIVDGHSAKQLNARQLRRENDELLG